MNNEEVAVMLGELLGLDAPITFGVPVPLEEVATVSIRTTPDKKMFLRFTFPDSTPRPVRSFFECIVEDPTLINEPTTTAVLARPWLSEDFFLQLIFSEYAPMHVLTRCIPADQGNGVITTSVVIGIATSELETAFLTISPTGSIRHLDPAVIIRLFALCGPACEELLFLALEQDLVGNFGLDRFFAHHDALPDDSLPKRLCKEALQLELEGCAALGITTDIEGFRTRLNLPNIPTSTRADVVSTFHLAVESDPEKFAQFYIDDPKLHFVAFRADHYQMELIDIRRPDVHFSDLVVNNPFKVIANGPVFALGLCAKQSDIIRGMFYLIATNDAGFIIPRLTKGRLVFRGQPDEVGDCPIPEDPGSWRYHFAQSTNGEYHLHRNFIPENHGFASAIEPVIGVFREGKRIGAAHEIDMLGSDGKPRGEPDSVYANKNKAETAGIPIIGTCRRMQVDYVFVLCRPDYYVPRLKMASWEDMISLMRDVGVVDAFITDGDDSLGLIVDNTLIIEPGFKKSIPMPLAIGFRRV
ncbi:hypothetical protein [Kocuria sp. LHG3120]|uniref:hypothetical protein n=1 Tax=Kocuria sp. LHG3120 TaxID=2804590 RepID=UPI003CE9B23C